MLAVMYMKSLGNDIQNQERYKKKLQHSKLEQNCISISYKLQ